jgi:hypothetical protein
MPYDQEEGREVLSALTLTELKVASSKYGGPRGVIDRIKYAPLDFSRLAARPNR